MRDDIYEMSNIIVQLKQLHYFDDSQKIIDKCTKIINGFQSFKHKLRFVPESYMMDLNKYGEIQEDFFQSVCAMNKKDVDLIIENTCISSHNYLDVFDIDIELIARCVWFYAMEKPYSVVSFNKSVKLLNALVDKPQIDVTIAEWYAMKQMGGEEVLHDRIRELLKKNITSEKLTFFASSLMWIGAYQAENMILSHMLSEGMQMSAKVQERLHSLKHGRGKSPEMKEIQPDRNLFHLDVSVLAWQDSDYEAFFENLSFKEKKLLYSLAIRDEDKDLFIDCSINIPPINNILEIMKKTFKKEYDSLVILERKKCKALSGNTEEEIDGILIFSKECPHMGIFVYLARIGNKLNIKFYTVFIPNSEKLSTQKQQVLSLYKKLSPSVTIWESSLKDSVLTSIQQLLNTNNQIVYNETNDIDEKIETAF